MVDDGRGDGYTDHRHDVQHSRIKDEYSRDQEHRQRQQKDTSHHSNQDEVDHQSNYRIGSKETLDIFGREEFRRD